MVCLLFADALIPNHLLSMCSLYVTRSLVGDFPEGKLEFPGLN
jgi:hypothetical protein